MTTLRQLSEDLGVHPYDLVGDSELADELLEYDDDIEDTIFYEELKAILKQDEYDQTHFTVGISI
mgnify:FL=1|jgi:hypothetical protein